MNGPSSTPPPPTAVNADGTALAQALQVTRDTLTALQRMQEQTANLHRQFLEGQESAQRGVHLLIEQQQRLLQAWFGMPMPEMSLAALPPPPPVAVMQPPAPPPAALQPVPKPQPPVEIAKPQTAVVAPPPLEVAKPQLTAPTNRIETTLLKVISEKTGYPPEMLELDMALDADLGIDSIKRVEILSALQEQLPDAPQIKPEHLGTLHNLRQIVAFLGNGDPQTQGQAGLPVQRAFELTLDADSHPVLKSHVLNGRPVLPMALILEYLAHAALHQNPGFTFHGCDDFRILHGVILEDGKPLTMRVGAGKAIKRHDGFFVPVELRTVRPDGRETLHARADVVLTTSLPAAPSAALAAAEIVAQEYAYTPTEIYRTHLFHGPDLQGIQHVEGHGEHGIAASVRSAPPPAAWIKNPMRQQWLIDPLIVDVGFQLVVLWSLGQRGAGSLPCYVSRYRQYRPAFPEEGVRVVVQVTSAAELHAFADMEYQDSEGHVIARMGGYECVIDPGLQRAFERRVMVKQ